MSQQLYKIAKRIPTGKTINLEYNPDVVLAYGILKRLYRRMQMRGVRIMQVARKGRNNSTLLYRAYTWEEACRMIEIEMGALKCRIKRINRT